MHTSAVFDVYESASQLLLGALAFAGLIIVVMCGIGGGLGSAAVAVVMLGFAAVLALFVMSLGIVPFLDAKPTGKLTVEGSILRDSSTGRAVDFALPHTFHVLASQRVVRTQVQGRFSQWEQSLAYDWVAFVFEQGETRLTLTQPNVSASYDSGDVSQRRANRSFLGQAPTLRTQKPDGIVVDTMRFDDLERAIATAQTLGFRAQHARG